MNVENSENLLHLFLQWYIDTTIFSPDVKKNEMLPWWQGWKGLAGTGSANWMPLALENLNFPTHVAAIQALLQSFLQTPEQSSFEKGQREARLSPGGV